MSRRNRFTAPAAGLAIASVLALGGTAQAAITVFSYTGSEASFTVQRSGLYRIYAFGASGGAHRTPPGLGGEIGGDLTLTQGEVLTILVGGQGQPGWASGNGGGGGGGGTFIAFGCATNCIPLVIAGGGGGGGGDHGGFGTDGGFLGAYGVSGGSDGAEGDPGGAGGAGGAGGLGGGGVSGAGGGGGFFGDGASSDGQGGASFVNGGAGGGTFTYGQGGFGGGGSAGYAYPGAGGGGGGYSGGGGGAGNYSPSGGDGGGGGGGGSYIDPSATNVVAYHGAQIGDGFATITPLFGVPEPETWTLMLAGFGVLGGAMRAVRGKRLPAKAWFAGRQPTTRC